MVTAPALVSEGKSKKGQVAPDPEKIWKVIQCYDTSNTARLDPEDRKYYQYQHALLDGKELHENVAEADS